MWLVAAFGVIKVISPCNLQILCAEPAAVPPAEVKQTRTVGPVLIHVITDKGRGYDPSRKAADRMHGVTKFDPRTGKQAKGKPAVSPSTLLGWIFHRESAVNSNCTTDRLGVLDPFSPTMSVRLTSSVKADTTTDH